MISRQHVKKNQNQAEMVESKGIKNSQPGSHPSSNRSYDSTKEMQIWDLGHPLQQNQDSHRDRVMVDQL